MARSNIGSLLVRLGMDTKDYDTKMARAKKSAGRFTKDMTKFAGSIGLAFGAIELGGLIKDSAILAGKVEGVRNAFEKLNKPGLLDNLRRATDNTVSDFELMQAAVKFSNFQLPLDKLGSLLTFVGNRAKATGESMDLMLDSLVEGLSKDSALRLDNLGISVGRLRENIAKFGGDESDAFIRIVEGEELVKMGNVARTAGDRVLQLSSAWENLKVKIGDLANEFTNKLAPAITQALNKMQEFLDTQFSSTSQSKHATFGEFFQALTEESGFFKPAMGLFSIIDRMSELAQERMKKNAKKNREAMEKMMLGFASPNKKSGKTGSAAGASPAPVRHGRPETIGTDQTFAGRILADLRAMTPALEGVGTSFEMLGKRAVNSVEPINKEWENMQRIIQVNLQSAFVSLFNAMTDGIKSLTDAIKALLKQLAFQGIARIASFFLTGGLAGPGIGLAGKGFFGGLKSIFGFAGGTPFQSGGLSIVGERGPELANLGSGPVFKNGSGPMMAATVNISGSSNPFVTKLLKQMIDREVKIQFRTT